MRSHSEKHVARTHAARRKDVYARKRIEREM